jgi:hypothetical protein
MMTKPPNKQRKSKEHGDWYYTELPHVLYGADCAQQQPWSSRNKGHTA